jgi:TolA-binding protein
MTELTLFKLTLHSVTRDIIHSLISFEYNSNKRKSFLVEKHEAEIQELKNEISEHNIRISELEQLNTLLKNDQLLHLKMESTQ